MMLRSVLIVAIYFCHVSRSFSNAPLFITSTRSMTKLYSDWKEGDDGETNTWIQSEMDFSSDWDSTTLDNQQEESSWTRFESSEDPMQERAIENSETADEEAWLDTLAQLTSEEVEFNMKEADRADKARQMEELGFDVNTIANTLDVATDSTLEDQVEGMQTYQDEAFGRDALDDLSDVESHTRVEIDEDGESIRSQMVYVDEHACIGCTNCAMIARNTFYMNDEHGRARVYEQWGDDDETIQIAIETCPVDCIHYVPFEELVKLEVERRDQNINFKARLTSQGEVGDRVGGAVRFTPPQEISGNLASRCNNCPSSGCKNCPMYGVGKNPEFEKREKKRQAKIAKAKMKEEREKDNKSADL
mmetsp:Transcript_29904/g.44214  ORF Transcript_29904/g.44214 Transcript_29904/m.44214 type:complete len:361 (+) Transcript_29904:213-1295(+)